LESLELDTETRPGRSLKDADDEVEEPVSDGEPSLGVWIDGGEDEFMEDNGDCEVGLDDGILAG
jgi:hypothetical protein